MRQIRLLAAVIGVLFLLPQAGAVADADNPSASDVPELHFPREGSNDRGSIVIHAPQIESWDNFDVVTGVAAVEATLAGSDKTNIGAVGFKAKTITDVDARIVTIYDTEITSVSFPDATETMLSSLEQLVHSHLRGYPQYMPLDVVLLSVQDVIEIRNAEGFTNEPPIIQVSTEPAVLVIIDGETALNPIEQLHLQYALNTNWDLFYDTKKKNWYLLNDKQWLTTDDLDTGTWKQAKKLPKHFKKLPQTKSFAKARAAVPPSKEMKPVPRVIVEHKPTELILIEGEPEYRDIPETSIREVTNTESDLFRIANDWYYLVSGRWFSTKALDRPWTPIEDLPGDFANIPSDDPVAHVRAAVSGTEEATLAVLEAQIPRKASVPRNSGDNVEVLYVGEPQFVPIQTTSLQRAANSDSDVILAGSTYYLCKNAVWYQSASPNGPWVVTDTIPAAIYDIPASDPVYHTTYVRVVESSPSTVSFSYYSGYYGVYSYYGVPVYGTGWYYPPYYGYYGGYPYYYSYPYSYGASTWYNPATGAYGRGASVYGPYGGYGRAAQYNPTTGTYARGEAVWDNNEMAGRAVAYNPRTGTGVATNRYANEDGSWGESVITRGDNWTATQGEFTSNRADIDFQNSRGTTGNVTRERNGDTVTGTATATRGGRTVDTTTTRTGNQSTTNVTTSGGATGQIDRTRQGDSISSTGSFQRGGETITTDGSITRGGARTTFESSSGAQGAFGRSGGSNYGVAQSASGDLYVGRDQNVYKRTGDGWSSYNNGQWSDPQQRERRTERGDTMRTQRSTRDAFPSSTPQSRQRRQSGLDRQHRARSGGYSNYNRNRGNYNRSANRSRTQMSRPRGGMRRGGRRR